MRSRLLISKDVIEVEDICNTGVITYYNSDPDFKWYVDNVRLSMMFFAALNISTLLLTFCMMISFWRKRKTSNPVPAYTWLLAVNLMCSLIAVFVYGYIYQTSDFSNCFFTARIADTCDDFLCYLISSSLAFNTLDNARKVYKFSHD